MNKDPLRKTRIATLRELSDADPDGRWIVRSGPADDCSLTYRKQDLRLFSLSSAEHSVCLERLARRNTGWISFYFVVTGEIEVSDRPRRKIRHIPSGHVASVRETPGKRLTIQPSSSWLALHLPQSALRQHFEELTGHPYLQEFCLPPTNFRDGSAQDLYQILLQALNILSASPMEETFVLARAYYQLVLTQLYTKLPHNLAGVFVSSTPSDAPREVLRTEALMRDRLFEPVTLKELTDAAGCTERTLQRLFRTYRGRSPMGVLCNMRLAAAHHAIRNCERTSMTDLAMKLQFSNPARFSALYKRAYGLSPSRSMRLNRREDFETSG